MVWTNIKNVLNDVQHDQTKLISIKKVFNYREKQKKKKRKFTKDIEENQGKIFILT